MDTNMVSDLLKEIRSESLSMLLQRHRDNMGLPGPLFLPQLDVILRTSSTLHPGTIFELVGGPKTGKTQFLYFLAMTTILPYEWVFKTTINNRARQYVVQLDGRESSILILTKTFDVVRIAELMRTHIHAKLDDLNIDKNNVVKNIDELILLCLRGLHIFYVTSSAELLNTLRDLPDYIRKSDERFVFLFIDGLGPFYWPDRSKNGNITVSTVRGIKTNLLPLIDIILSLGVVGFITNWAMRGNSHLISTWKASCTRIDFIRVPIGQFPPGHSLDNAIRDEKKWRSKLVDNGVVTLRRYHPRNDIPSVELQITDVIREVSR